MLFLLYFYPRSPCGERHANLVSSVLDARISIHALLAESDAVVDNIVFVPGKFLSTLSLRRATGVRVDKTQSPPNFYPRSPCGERRFSCLSTQVSFLFLSTLSLRRATKASKEGTRKAEISIHALLAESDLVQIIISGYARISIHALLAESDSGHDLRGRITQGFLSTLSLRRATHLSKFNTSQRVFLSTLSLRRATLRVTSRTRSHPNFYPRSPCGERPVQVVVVIMHALFLSTLSLRRATRIRQRNNFQQCHFYPRSPCGERHNVSAPNRPKEQFLSTLSLRRAT